MDISAPQLSYSTQCHWNYPSSDSEFYSVSSPETISPSSSTDFPFSPPCHQRYTATLGTHTGYPDAVQASRSPSSSEEGLLSVQKLRKTRSKNPSKQRQSASEKEKLRMRDLAKALHHLRTYLPPSVAPAGQTLTKIETLRLTIRYISHLSEQLGLSEEAPSQRRGADVTRCPTLPEELLCYQSSAVPEGALQEEGMGSCQYSSMPACSQQDKGMGSCQYSSMPACSQQDEGTGYYQYSSMPACSQQDEVLDSSTESLLQSPQFPDATQSCQMYSEDFNSQVLPQEFWS
ncbi:mesoderm posterior protein 1-like [Acipenser oxyrinchus oxyrinchus]|uniref:Mesoderm posterior protein 1-like n=1 Tax=Acipenser oxyrinchus oxyrinchus TaxID=40147 RepID=A0AAD8FUN7_ACIOX|nr:mesoderm posterior protein 1-like [Acipenser oxyrinchus oxyrinchus]